MLCKVIDFAEAKRKIGSRVPEVENVDLEVMLQDGIEKSEMHGLLGSGLVEFMNSLGANLVFEGKNCISTYSDVNTGKEALLDGLEGLLGISIKDVKKVSPKYLDSGSLTMKNAKLMMLRGDI